MVIHSWGKRANSVILYIITSLMMPFFVLNLLNVHLWGITFNPIDYILKPFILIPIAYLFITLFIRGTSYVVNLILMVKNNVHAFHAGLENKWKAYSPVLYIMTSLILSYAVFFHLNVFLWNISFNPIDYILKPFMITPFTSLFLILFIEWIKYAFNFTRELSLTIKKADGKLSFKVVEKSLPIYIIDESYLNQDLPLRNNTIVDMRIKDRDYLPYEGQLDVIKLYNHDNQVNIPYLIDKANQIIRNTALKNKPITFIVDSKKERNRTISKIWLRLIRYPNSKTAKADIHTILELVY